MTDDRMDGGHGDGDVAGDSWPDVGQNLDENERGCESS